MCAACVAQGITYVGGAVGALQVMRARARIRLSGGPGEGEQTTVSAEAAGPADDDEAGLKAVVRG